MLIKIDKGRYVNTYYISQIEPAPTCTPSRQLNKELPSYNYHLIFSNGSVATVTEHIAAYIIAFMEPNEGLIDEAPTTNQPQPQLSLPSRIAIFIKNHPDGVQLYDLQEEFVHELDDELAKAINALLREGVLISNGLIYQHKATAGSANATPNVLPEDTW